LEVSFSEYGCITNNRTFQEVSALYNTEMTGVFSGGLVYEYSQEGNGYGLVTINGDSVVEDADFGYLQTALANTPNPSGNGGANATSAASACPTASAEWDVPNDDLPALPAAAERYMTEGAGPGPGLTGAGSQSAGNSSTESAGTAAAGSEGPTATTSGTPSSSSTKSAAAALKKPLDMSTWWMAAIIVLAGTFLGTILIEDRNYLVSDKSSASVDF
jgi:1,3-beta-glucanosyltransferase GAS5